MGYRLSATEKASRAAARKAFDATKHFKPGDIVVNSWGWEQTNADFYRVEKVAKNRLTIIKLKTLTTETGFMCGTAVPGDEDPFGKVPLTVGAYLWDDGKRIGVKFRFGSGEKWDGEPERVSWYG